MKKKPAAHPIQTSQEIDERQLRAFMEVDPIVVKREEAEASRKRKAKGKRAAHK